MAKKDGKSAKRAKPKKPQITVYFESEEQVNAIKRAARGNFSEYCRERILFEGGYTDERHKVASRMLCLASQIMGELHLISDLVRSSNKLAVVLNNNGIRSKDLAAVAKEMSNLVSQALRAKERRVDLEHELLGAIREYAGDLAARETVQRVATNRSWARPDR